MPNDRRGREPRTVLEFLIWQQDRTYEELVTEFHRKARDLGEDATISARHLRRLASGERDGTTPVTRRVLQQLFGQPVDQLLTTWQDRSTGLIEPIATGTPALIEAATDRGMISMAANRARQFALITGQIGLTSDALEQIHEDVHELAMAYPQRPLSEILADLVSVQDLLFSLLEQRQRPDQAKHLYFLAGVNGGLLAKASHDLADPHAAMTQARTAFMCADHSDHDGLRAWIRGLQSFVSYWAKRHNEAIRYAQQGAEFATRSRNTSMVWLAMNEARSWAALGNAINTTAAIQRAEDSWNRVQPDEMDELGGIATFSRPRQLYYAADALAWLPSETEHAERYSAEAIVEYADTSRPEWAFGDQAGSHSDLAIARIQRGEVEGATEALAPVLDLPPEQRINGIIQSVEHVHQVLSKAPASGEARELQERIEFFTRTPMKALPM
ncbi:hypothetical protein OHA25_04905 [Nonomuraea sp. NBC_00507]|uniref:hypothetical protein n=1 Tax=Nonomuraea sp. NBC_00507 TaxID=2976002 RepID=UPI002E176621